MEQALRDAGFGAVTSEPVTVVLEFDSAEAFVTFRRDVSSAEARIAGYPRERREAAWRAVAEAIERYRADGGGIAIPNLSYCLAGRR